MLDRLLKGYYYATPIWWLADSLWGVNVRAVGFEFSPHLKQAYYGLCLLSAVLIWFKPAWISGIALLESSVNILSLILGVLSPAWQFANLADSPTPYKNPLTPAFICNFIAAGTIACVAFYRSVNWFQPRR